MPERIALLGSTGSIGTQALDIISKYPERFIVEVLIAGNNLDLLVQQANKYQPDSVVIANPDHYLQLKEYLKHTNIKVYAGNEAIEQVVSSSTVDIVIASIVGYSGVRPTIAAIKAGKKIALATKKLLLWQERLLVNLSETLAASLFLSIQSILQFFNVLPANREILLKKLHLQLQEDHS